MIDFYLSGKMEIEWKKQENIEILMYFCIWLVSMERRSPYTQYSGRGLALNSCKICGEMR